MYDLIKLAQPGSKTKKKPNYRRKAIPKDWVPNNIKKSTKEADEFLHVILDAPLCNTPNKNEDVEKKTEKREIIAPPKKKNRKFPLFWTPEIKAPNSKSIPIAKTMVKPGGSGTKEDALAVAMDLAVFPPELLLLARDRLKVKVVACRNSVTDYDKASYLQGGEPRGWEEGSDWVNVPGVALFDMTAVIATKEVGGKRVPSPYGYGHGAYNLVGHEFLHAFNFGRNKSGLGTVDPKFRKNRLETLKLIEKISPSILKSYNIDYYRQKGEPGRQESHAESGCRWFYGDQLMRTSGVLRPLAEYWKAVEHELGISSQ